MNQQDRFLLTGFAIFSAITSFLFAFYGVSIITGGGETNHWLRSFAYVVGGYGLANIYILSWAWRSQAKWTDTASKFISVSFLGIFVMDRINQGLKGGMEIAVMLGLAAVLFCNWFTIKRLIQRERS